MAKARRDADLIDRIDAVDPVPFKGTVWRVVGNGRDPLLCSASGGRWDDGTFDVLYTSTSRPGAIEEMRYHLTRGQPVMPSKAEYRVFEIELSLEAALQLPDMEALASVGLNAATFGRLAYEQKKDEYPRTQEIGEVAHFLDFDGLVIPSARSDAMNVVVFCDRVRELGKSVVTDRGAIDWARD